MTEQKAKLPKLLFLFSDTGGGHRSAAEAVIEAFEAEYPGMFDIKMVDFFVEYAPPPLNNSPADYPTLSSMKLVWKVGYEAIDGRRRSKWLFDVIWPYIQKGATRLVAENPADLYVSFHSLINEPLLRVFRKNEQLVCVVTDLITPPAPWYNARTNLTIVPTEPAFQRGLQLGIPPEKMKVIGLPVAKRFCEQHKDRAEIRARLGWHPTRVITLLVGGGQGLGPLEKNAHAIDAANLDTQLVIVAGRNPALKQRLEKYPWNNPPLIYGFVSEMPDFMCAADILVTKAGPGSICEGFIAGLPIILYNRIPGQEEDNVTYVVEQGAGIWAPRPVQVVETIRDWLEHPHTRQAVARASARLACPQASSEIARTLVHFLHTHNPELFSKDSQPNPGA